MRGPRKRKHQLHRRKPQTKASKKQTKSKSPLPQTCECRATHCQRSLGSHHLGLALPLVLFPGDKWNKQLHSMREPFFAVILWMDDIHLAAPKICSGIIIPKILGWCRISSIHRRAICVQPNCWPRFLREMLAQDEVVTIPKIDLDVGVSLFGTSSTPGFKSTLGWLQLTRPTLQRLAMPISAADPYIVCWRSLA